jgi:EAL domain-containing protein (putative c-di-GMP-specific phosphodiesterase class I)
MPETPQLQALGIDGVRVVAAPLQGVATQPEVAKLARELFAQLRGMQLQVVADEVGDEADRQALWGLGIDGVQEPAAPAEA